MVFTTIATEFGIESYARNAFNRGFYSVVASDCVSSPYEEGHYRSIENMKNLITMTDSKEIDTIWSNTYYSSNALRTDASAEAPSVE